MTCEDCGAGWDNAAILPERMVDEFKDKLNNPSKE